MFSKNWLLASLAPPDAAALRPHLVRIALAQGEILSDVGEVIQKVYFPETAVVSIVVGLSTGEFIEASMTGHDGVVNAATALDGRVALSRAIVQLGGDAIACSIAGLRGAAMQSQTLLALIIRHEQVSYAHAQQSTACIATHQIEARLCRWLLRARDLIGSDNLPFTQEFLAEMLAVSRTSVTVTAHSLQQSGFLSYSRGKIQILDVDGLRQATCECYETIRGLYERLRADSP